MPVNASTTVLGTLGIAALLVAVDVFWNRVQLLSTLLHEVGHGVVFLVTGNWVKSLAVSPGGGGATSGSGSGKKLFWPSDVAITLSGYPAPSIAGLLLARGVEVGWNSRTVLGVLLILLVGVALFHADWFTLVVIVAAGLLGALFFYRAGPTAQTGAVIAMAWFLLLAGLRQSLYASALNHRDRRGGSSDAAVLQDLTAVHAHAWSLFFVFIALSAFIAGARWLLY